METPNFVEKAAYEKGFAKFFDKQIKSLLQKIEDNRLKQYAEYKKRKVIAVPLIIVVLIGAVFLTGAASASDDAGGIIGLAFSICVLIWMTWVRAPIKKYNVDVKSKFMPVICEFFGNLKYAVHGWLDRKDILSLEIFPKYTKAESEDFISGEYKSFKLHMNELTLKARRSSGKGSRWVTVFKGLVIVIGFPKAFEGKTVLRRDVGKFGNWWSKISHDGLERIELEDPDFESIFEVYSSDQIEARFLLTTAFMERLLSLARLRTGDVDLKPSVQCEFYRNELVIAVPSDKNLFEPGNIGESALGHEDIHLFLQQMDEVFQLIDVLKLDRV